MLAQMPKRHRLGLLPFERTSLWNAAFGARNDKDRESKAFYAENLRSLRDKVRALVDRIRADMPYLTVHDITHLDSLWETGSTIAGPSYTLEPAEGYAFGAAVLLHDAAMCLAAYPRGINELRLTDEWKDTIAMLQRSQQAHLAPADFQAPPDEIVRQAVPIALRLLHARQAEELPRTKWTKQSGDVEYLIEHGDLRAFHGQLIGKIARSHGEGISWGEFRVCSGPRRESLMPRAKARGEVLGALPRTPARGSTP